LGAKSEVVTEIRARITDGRIRPGERITEERLAEELGISRTPVREALISLGALGQVARERSGWRTQDHDAVELRDAFRLRACLESFAAFHAAKDADDEQIEAIGLAQELMAKASREDFDSPLERAQRIAPLNRDFHDAVTAASNNSRLPGVMDAAVIGPLVFSSFSWYTDEQLRRSNDMHSAIRDAVVARDPQRAGWLMAEHLLQGWDAIASLFEDEGEDGRGDLWHRLQTA
jgi:DNA-binding GntR family transcriptional regulator